MISPTHDMLDEDPRMNSHESPSVRWFYLPKEGKITVEDDASRVSIESAGGLVFSFC